MAVHAKRRVNGVGRLEYAVCANDLLKQDHPLRKTFDQWRGDKPATKRQASRFLQQYPHYREIQSA